MRHIIDNRDFGYRLETERRTDEMRANRIAPRITIMITNPRILIPAVRDFLEEDSK